MIEGVCVCGCVCVQSEREFLQVQVNSLQMQQQQQQQQQAPSVVPEFDATDEDMQEAGVCVYHVRERVCVCVNGCVSMCVYVFGFKRARVNQSERWLQI